jgi:hypothetical protein
VTLYRPPPLHPLKLRDTARRPVQLGMLLPLPAASLAGAGLGSRRRAFGGSAGSSVDGGASTPRSDRCVIFRRLLACWATHGAVALPGCLVGLSHSNHQTTGEAHSFGGPRRA